MGAGTDSSGVTTLVALDGRTATRLIWPAGASAPAAAGDVAVPPPGPVIPIWDVNSRGDLLDVERSGSGQLRAVVSDAGGGTAGFRAPAGAEQVAGALGADGTAVVAWTRSDDEDALPKVWVRVRRGRGSFAPAVVIPARGPVRAVAVDVATDGRIALALAVWNGHRHVILHTEPRADGRFTVPVRLGSTPASDLLYLAALAGGPGSGRVIFTADMREETLAAVLRTGPSTWGAPQRLEPGSGDDAEFFGTALAPLADGGVALAYQRRQSLVVRRAPRGGAFQRPQTVAAIPANWTSAGSVLAVNRAGDLLLAWSEFLYLPTGGLCFVIACPDRVRAAFAPAGHSFAPAQTLSPLGTVTADEFTVAAALSDEGRRLVAWKTAGIDAGRPDSLLAAMGDPSPEPPVAGDHTAPRVSIAVTRAALAEAASGEPLVARITCSEPCAVVAGVFPSGYVNDYTTAVAGLRVAVLPAGSNPTTWHLDPAQARIAHTLVMDPGATVNVVAVDSAGNIGLAQSSLERQANARP